MNFGTLIKKPLRGLNSIARKLSDKNYYSSMAYKNLYFYTKNFIDNFPNKEPLLILQMGKVGSKTVYESLKILDLNMAIYHLHILSKKRIRRNEDQLKIAYPEEKYISGHFIKNNYLRRRVENDTKVAKWRVVTLVRDPVARNISDFFQNIRNRQPEFDFQLKFETMGIDEFMVELIDLFWNRYDNNITEGWFDIEIKGTFGIDVFASDFPKSKGYEIYKGRKAELLLIRLEDLRRCARKAFKEFLDIEDFNLVDSNIAKKKEYYHIYKRFLDTIVLSETYLDEIYSIKWVKQFYSDDEITELKTKWRKKSTHA